MDLRIAKESRVEAETDDWSSINGDILLLIAEKIRSVHDYVRLCAVCRSWYLLATDFYTNQTHKLNLFQPYYFSGNDSIPNRPVINDHNVENNDQVFTLTNPSSDSILQLSSPGHISLCWGSPFGWLITFDRSDNLRFSLLNPFTRATIPLPCSLPKSWEPRSRTGMLNAFLTANPDTDPDNCLVIVYAGPCRLAFARLGGHRKNWSHVKSLVSMLHGVAYFQGNLYGITSSGVNLPVHLVLFDLNHRRQSRYYLIQTLTLDAIFYPETPQHCAQKHLFTLDGHLCLCVSLANSFGFKIFKIDLDDGNFTQLHSLGGHCLYLGHSCSFSSKTSYSLTNEFASNCVFNYKTPRQVWDVEHSRMVHIERDHWPKRLMYTGLWILPSINFQKLEADL